MKESEELPLGLGMALAMNNQAMFYYSRLDEVSRREIIQRAKSVNSKEEMKAFVDRLGTKEDNAGENKSFT